jgi:hypothetical protein
MWLPQGPEESSHTSPNSGCEVPGVLAWLGRVCNVLVVNQGLTGQTEVAGTPCSVSQTARKLYSWNADF